MAGWVARVSQRGSCCLCAAEHALLACAPAHLLAPFACPLPCCAPAPRPGSCCPSCCSSPKYVKKAKKTFSSSFELHLRAPSAPRLPFQASTGTTLSKWTPTITQSPTLATTLPSHTAPRWVRHLPRRQMREFLVWKTAERHTTCRAGSVTVDVLRRAAVCAAALCDEW